MSVMLRLAAFSLCGVLTSSLCVSAHADTGGTGGAVGLLTKRLPAQLGRSSRVKSCEARPRFWRRVVGDVSRDYCRDIHKAQANLWSRPKTAQQYAEEALGHFSDGVLAHLILGQSLLIQGDSDAAYQYLSTWGERAPPTLRDAYVRVSTARAALLTGHYTEAVSEYRAAILLADQHWGSQEKTRVLIEAATAVTYSGPGRGREARHYLTLAQELRSPLLVEVVQAAQVLSWIREGEVGEARFVLAPDVDPWTLPWIIERSPSRTGHPREVLPVLPAGEDSALIAAVAEVAEPDTAGTAWETFRAEAGEGCPEHLCPSAQEAR